MVLTVFTRRLPNVEMLPHMVAGYVLVVSMLRK